MEQKCLTESCILQDGHTKRCNAKEELYNKCKDRTVPTLIESQNKLREVFQEAMGVYIAEEPKKQDTWRECQYWQLWNHFKHEVQEIERSETPDRQYHNMLDAINLLAMLGVRVKEGVKK